MGGEFGNGHKPRFIVRWYRDIKAWQAALNEADAQGYGQQEWRREQIAGVWGYVCIFKHRGVANGQEAKPDARNEIAEYCRRQEERREQDRRARLEGLEAREHEEGST